MTVRVNKSAFNIREKLSELERPIGVKGNELMRAETAQDARDLVSAGRKNLIINGGFDVWQRGTTGTVVGGPGYTSADRWRMYVNTSTTMTLSRQSFSPGQTEVPGNPSYYARFDWLGTGASQFFAMEQFIEGCHHGAGDYLTVSFYARSQYGDDMYLGVNQNFGSGGSAQQNITNSLINLETSWKKFVYTLKVPSISGKTINKSDDSISVTFYRTGTLNSYLEVSQVQLEVGKNATEFEHRSYGEELALCQRYYQKHLNPALRGVAGGSTALNRMGTSLPVTMRDNPVLSVEGTFSWYDGNVTGTFTSANISATHSRASFIEIEAVAATGTTTLYNPIVTYITGTASYIICSSEL